MSFMGVAVGMGATGIGATLLAGGMMGGATSLGMNILKGKDPFSNLGQGILMGGATAGLASAAGSALGGATPEAIAAAKAVPATTGAAAADAALQQANTIRTAAIDSTVGKAALGFDANTDPTGFYPDAYRQQLTSGAAPIDYGQITQGGAPTALANQYGAENIREMLASGMTPGDISQQANEYAANNAVVPPAGMQDPGMQTKIANYLVSNPTKASGIAGGIMSLQPKPFAPQAVKPVSFYETEYFQPKYNQVTGKYSSGYFGPGTRSPVYRARGGSVGSDELSYPHTGDPIANTGGYFSKGEKPKNSRNVYGDEENVYGDDPGPGAFTDADAVYSNTKLDKRTPAKELLARARKTKDDKTLRTLVDDVKSAAEGGLMGTYAAGGKLLRGPGDGMSDSIPAVINGVKPQRAALADGEFVIPADVVSHLGNGSTEAGSKRLYSMMARIRKARTGNPKQGKQINPDRFMPA